MASMPDNAHFSKINGCLGDHFFRMKQCFAERLTHTKSFCGTHGLPMPTVLSPLTDLDFATIATESLSQCLQPLVTAHFCTSVMVEDLSAVGQSRAKVLEPRDFCQDDFTKFVSSLALSVEISAALYSVASWARISIQAKFPDGRRLLFSPASSEIRWAEQGEAKLDTTIILSHGVWTDPCQVEFCVVMRYPTDVAEDSCFPFCTALQQTVTSTGHRTGKSDSTSSARGRSVLGANVHVASNSVHSHPEDSFERETSVLAISDVVRVNIHPQQSSSRSYNVFS